MTLEESSRTRKHLSLSEKIEVISFFNNVKCSVRKLAKYFNIGKTQAGHIVKQKDRLLELWYANGEIKNGKLRPDSIGYQIDKYVYNWYSDTKNENIPVSGPMIQNKALEIAKELGHEEFKASNGWLERFRIRHKINHKAKNGKNNASLSLDQWKEKLESVTSTYSAENVFGAVETGLFYRAAPEETPSLISDVLLDRNVAEERLTVLLCASLAGEKEKPLAVVKPPPAGSDPCRFPPNCAFNGSACLTVDILARWLGEFDARMASQNRSAALLLLGDSLSSLDHPKLANTELLHVPAGLFPERPCHRVVRNFKVVYRQLLLGRLVENGGSPAPRMDPSEGVALVEAAWERVGGCLLLGSFFGEIGCALAANLGDDGEEVTLDDVADLLRSCGCDVGAEDYVGIDADLVTLVDAGRPEILEVLVNGDEMRNILTKEDRSRNLLPDVYGTGDGSGQFNPSIAQAVNSYPEALRCLRGLEQFYLSQNDPKATVLVNQLIVLNEEAKNEQLKSAAQ